MMGSILAEVQQNFDQMSVDDLKAHLAKFAEQKAKQAQRQAEYNASPEAKAKRVAYQKTRNETIKQDPEAYAKLQAKRKEYMNRPENKAKRQAYHAKRNATFKAVIAAAKAKGIDVDAYIKASAPAPDAQPAA